MLRRYTRINACLLYYFEEVIVAHLVEFFAGISIQVLLVAHFEIVGNGNCGILEVACDHDGSDACFLTYCDSVLGFLTCRVDHADEA